MKTYLYLFVMAATTYLIRVLPLTLIRKPIQNPFLRSFLFYVPYVTLAVMTRPWSSASWPPGADWDFSPSRSSAARQC